MEKKIWTHHSKSTGWPGYKPEYSAQLSNIKKYEVQVQLVS